MPPPPPQLHGSVRRPVTSNKGGYLRCPFDINARFADLAEKHVSQGISSAKAASAMREDKDGLLDETAGGRDGPRPWTRAGVGASGLSAKDKRAQQEQAEKIYCGEMRNADGGGDDGGAASSSGLSQENLFAVDSREQEALKRMVPRHVRMEKQRGHRDDDHDDDDDAENRGRVGSKKRPRGGNGVAEADDADDVMLSKAARLPTHHRVAEGAPLRNSNATSNSDGKTTSTTKQSPALVEEAVDAEVLPNTKGAAPVSAPRNSGRLAEAPKPMNRMQRLEQERQAALFGKKKKKGGR